MKESISYTFLLNIIIVFIFTCAAIIMGILSYYKAFRANTIISETIEKYEGYNCVSAEEIAGKLDTIGYNTPFDVNCNGKGKYCMTDTGKNYAVVSYNLDIPENSRGTNIVYKNSEAYQYTNSYSAEKYKIMNSTYKCDSTNGCVTNKHYQYGIYTYMYVDFPIFSKLIKVPLFSKTSILYEFRNFYVDEGKYMDVSSSYDKLYEKKQNNGQTYIKDKSITTCQEKVTETVTGEINKECVYKTARQTISDAILKSYTIMQTANGTGRNPYQLVVEHITGNSNMDYRTRAITLGYSNRFDNRNGKITYNAVAATDVLTGNTQRQYCGYIMDYSKIID